ncbi:MAG: LacI family DNA-binding transcriptional regulator [Alkalispirochaeta sp.]
MGETKGRRPTIRDVARTADVSVGTVSRVLNQHPNVHDRTRRRVLETMRAMGYEPVFAAQELGRGTRPTIGLSTGLGTRRLVPFFQVFHERLTESAANDGFRFIEIPTGPDGMPEHLADAMVLFGTHDDDARIQYLRQQGVPFAVIGHHPDCFSIASDDYDGGRIAAEHLLRLGHGSFWILTGGLNGQASRDRLRGSTDALSAAGVTVADRDILDTDLNPLGGYRAVAAALRSRTVPSAIIAATDELAIGAWAALDDHDLRVPGDVSIVGFDDLPEIGERLTTIHQDFHTLADTAIRLLRRAMSAEPPQQVLLPVRLVTRETTRRCDFP